MIFVALDQLLLTISRKCIYIHLKGNSLKYDSLIQFTDRAKTKIQYYSSNYIFTMKILLYT